MSLARRSYIFLVLIVLLGIAGQWSGEEFSQLWRYPAAAWLLGLLYEGTLARLRRPRLTLQAPASSPLGRPLQVEVEAHNDSAVATELETMPAFPADLATQREITRWSVPAAGTARRTLDLVPQRLGKIAWQTLYTRSLGRLGLAWWNHRLALPGELHVVPDRLQTDERRAGTQQQGDINRRVSGSGNELLGLRDYHHGDPLRAVDWKATARCNKHIVRVFSEEQHLELMLCIDVGRTSGLQADNLTRLHHYANIAARLAEKAIINGDHVGIVIYADKVIFDAPPGRGLHAMQRVRQALERLQTVPRESNPLTAALRVRELVRQRSLVAMFTDIDETTAAMQLLRATQLLAPKHLPLLAGINDREIEELYTANATDWLDPYYAFAASESRHARNKTVVQLQRLGAHVIESYPEHLDHRLLHYYDELRERHSV